MLYKRSPDNQSACVAELDVPVCGRQTLGQVVQPALQLRGIPSGHVTLDPALEKGSHAGWDAPADLFKVYKELGVKRH